MKILVVGGGGREHALVWKLAQSPRVTGLWCAPGNAGIANMAECIDIRADDVAGLKDFVLAKEIDLTIVGPEAPLAAGMVDEFRRSKLRIFGPTRNAAAIEGSKAFTKDLLVLNKISTAMAKVFESSEPALRYLETCPIPVVVKADGLAQGKGVIIAQSRDEAMAAVRSIMEEKVFGDAGKRVVIEEFLDGEEVTVMAFTDGKTVIPMPPAQDHKRVGDGDTGPNTGGMGTYAPAPIATPELLEHVHKKILIPVITALSRMGRPYQGVIYAGLMIVKGVPYVLEFNARFGDPETQVILPLLKTDLLDVIEAVVEHRLDQLLVEWHPVSAVCVVMTAGGYPGAYATGIPIEGKLALSDDPKTVVFHAGTKREQGRYVTAGGRVLGVTAVGTDLQLARDAAYERVKAITFEGCHYRTDIAHRALAPKAGL